MNAEERNQKLKRIMKLRSELFDIANEFALNDEGVIGSEIHESCNRILKAHKWATEGHTNADAKEQLREWFMKQPLFGHGHE